MAEFAENLPAEDILIHRMNQDELDAGQICVVLIRIKGIRFLSQVEMSTTVTFEKQFERDQ